MNRDLNQTLNCLFTLALLVLNREEDAWRDSSPAYSRQMREATLVTLRDYGLVNYADGSDGVFVTEEGKREALGVIKYLQLALGPALGATHDEIRGSWPRLFADQSAAGAGPLTMSEFVAAVAPGGRLPSPAGTPFSPTVLADPPASYHRDQASEQSLLLHLQLALNERGSYCGYFGGFYGEAYGSRGLAPCWRKVVVPAGLTFLDLHLIIQRCLSWTDERPFGFLLSTSRGNLLIGEPDVRGAIARPQTRKKKFMEVRASTMRLGDVFPRTHEATYAYGEGAPWEVAIRVLETHDGLTGLGPQLIDGVGDAPPEWVVGADGFAAFEDELYRSSRNVIRALSEASEKNFAPFALGVARERLAGFEQDRARWQTLLDDLAEKGAPPQLDDDDDLSRFAGYETCEDPVELDDDAYDDLPR